MRAVVFSLAVANGAVAFEAGAGQSLLENPFLVENGFGMAAGAPLLLEGKSHGALLVFDQAGRTFTVEDLKVLSALATTFVESPQPDQSGLPSRSLARSS